jgi:hypothetical protein
VNRASRFFVIKSFNFDNVYKSIKHGVWASTGSGNAALSKAFRKQRTTKTGNAAAPVLLFFNVNGSGNFQGMAEMTGDVDNTLTFDGYGEAAAMAAKGKFKGVFKIKWHFIKNVVRSATSCDAILRCV